MKKVITLILFIFIESFTLIFVIMLYQSNKQILIANEIFDNTIETLRARNFSSAARKVVQSKEDYQFLIENIDSYTYTVTMNYEVDFQNDKKTISTLVYQPH